MSKFKLLFTKRNCNAIARNDALRKKQEVRRPF